MTGPELGAAIAAAASVGVGVGIWCTLAMMRASGRDRRWRP